jgi:hypothetical protein
MEGHQRAIMGTMSVEVWCFINFVESK